jgi:hypothetical protein
MVKDLFFPVTQKSAQEYENRRVNAIEGGTLRGSDRKSQSFGDAMDSRVVVKRGDADRQECGAGRGCDELMAKVTTQVTRWI